MLGYLARNQSSLKPEQAYSSVAQSSESEDNDDGERFRYPGMPREPRATRLIDPYPGGRLAGSKAAMEVDQRIEPLEHDGSTTILYVKAGSEHRALLYLMQKVNRAFSLDDMLPEVPEDLACYNYLMMAPPTDLALDGDAATDFRSSILFRLRGLVVRRVKVVAKEPLTLGLLDSTVMQRRLPVHKLADRLSTLDDGQIRTGPSPTPGAAPTAAAGGGGGSGRFSGVVTTTNSPARFNSKRSTGALAGGSEPDTPGGRRMSKPWGATGSRRGRRSGPPVLVPVAIFSHPRYLEAAGAIIRTFNRTGLVVTPYLYSTIVAAAAVCTVQGWWRSHRIRGRSNFWTLIKMARAAKTIQRVWRAYILRVRLSMLSAIKRLITTIGGLLLGANLAITAGHVDLLRDRITRRGLAAMFPEQRLRFGFDPRGGGVVVVEPAPLELKPGWTEDIWIPGLPTAPAPRSLPAWCGLQLPLLGEQEAREGYGVSQVLGLREAVELLVRDTVWKDPAGNILPKDALPDTTSPDPSTLAATLAGGGNPADVVAAVITFPSVHEAAVRAALLTALTWDPKYRTGVILIPLHHTAAARGVHTQAAVAGALAAIAATTGQGAPPSPITPAAAAAAVAAATATAAAVASGTISPVHSTTHQPSVLSWRHIPPGSPERSSHGTSPSHTLVREPSTSAIATVATSSVRHTSGSPFRTLRSPAGSSVTRAHSMGRLHAPGTGTSPGTSRVPSPHRSISPMRSVGGGGGGGLSAVSASPPHRGASQQPGSPLRRLGASGGVVGGVGGGGVGVAAGSPYTSPSKGLRAGAGEVAPARRRPPLPMPQPLPAGLLDRPGTVPNPTSKFLDPLDAAATAPRGGLHSQPGGVLSAATHGLPRGGPGSPGGSPNEGGDPGWGRRRPNTVPGRMDSEEAMRQLMAQHAASHHRSPGGLYDTQPGGPAPQDNVPLSSLARALSPPADTRRLKPTSSAPGIALSPLGGGGTSPLGYYSSEPPSAAGTAQGEQLQPRATSVLLPGPNTSARVVSHTSSPMRPGAVARQGDTDYGVGDELRISAVTAAAAAAAGLAAPNTGGGDDGSSRGSVGAGLPGSWGPSPGLSSVGRRTPLTPLEEERGLTMTEGSPIRTYDPSNTISASGAAADVTDMGAAGVTLSLDDPYLSSPVSLPSRLSFSSKLAGLTGSRLPETAAGSAAGSPSAESSWVPTETDPYSGMTVLQRHQAIGLWSDMLLLPVPRRPLPGVGVAAVLEQGAVEHAVEQQPSFASAPAPVVPDPNLPYRESPDGAYDKGVSGNVSGGGEGAVDGEQENPELVVTTVPIDYVDRGAIMQKENEALCNQGREERYFADSSVRVGRIVAVEERFARHRQLMSTLMLTQVIGRQVAVGHVQAPNYMPLSVKAMGQIVAQMRRVYEGEAAELVAGVREAHRDAMEAVREELTSTARRIAATSAMQAAVLDSKLATADDAREQAHRSRVTRAQLRALRRQRAAQDRAFAAAFGRQVAGVGKQVTRGELRARNALLDGATAAITAARRQQCLEAQEHIAQAAAETTGINRVKAHAVRAAGWTEEVAEYYAALAQWQADTVALRRDENYGRMRRMGPAGGVWGAARPRELLRAPLPLGHVVSAAAAVAAATGAAIGGEYSTGERDPTQSSIMPTLRTIRPGFRSLSAGDAGMHAASSAAAGHPTYMDAADATADARTPSPSPSSSTPCIAFDGGEPLPFGTVLPGSGGSFTRESFTGNGAPGGVSAWPMMFVGEHGSLASSPTGSTLPSRQTPVRRPLPPPQGYMPGGIPVGMLQPPPPLVEDSEATSATSLDGVGASLDGVLPPGELLRGPGGRVRHGPRNGITGLERRGSPPRHLVEGPDGRLMDFLPEAYAVQPFGGRSGPVGRPVGMVVSRY